MKVIVTSHFSCYSLTWIFHSRNLEHCISRILERPLKLVYNDTPNFSFDELLVALTRDISVSIHQK